MSFENLNDELANLGRVHSSEGLRHDDLDADPLVQFGRWMEEALSSGVVLPNAMTLATATGDARPSARTVLLKGVDERGFLFFTNYGSRKGRELSDNPRAALVWNWIALERQVSATGEVERVSDEESDEYFATRPIGSRLAAWASHQSEILASRHELDASVAEVVARFPDGNVPRPPHWGGFRLVPDRVELWQARPDRLHDRFVYERSTDGWSIARLYP